MHSVRRTLQVGISVVAVALGGLAVVPAPAQAVPANIITVGSGCTLSEAILSAQVDVSFGSCAAGDTQTDEIQLPPGTYTGPFTIPSSFGALRITGQPGEASTTILDGGGTGTTLTIRAGAEVFLQDVSVVGGQGDAGVVTTGSSGRPGGIANAGELHLGNVIVTGNTGGTGGSGTFGSGGQSGGNGGAGGPGGIANSGELTLESGVSVTGNLGGSAGPGGFGGHAECIIRHTGGSQPFDYGSCVYPAGAGGQGGLGGAGGISNSTGTLIMSGDLSIADNDGGDGGAGGPGAHGSSVTVDGYPTCTPGGGGGAGGDGGPGGLYVGDGTAVSGDPEVVAGNDAGAGGAGGAGGTAPSSGGCGAGATGPDGADGQSEIRRGAQTLSWTAAPPDSQDSSTTFTPTAQSTSGLAPLISVADDCSLDGVGEVTLTGPAGTTCTVSADEAGNGFFLGATQLSKIVSITDSSAPVITPNIVGTVGGGGWYTTNVTLTWTVTDAESEVTDVVGCDKVEITVDQASIDYTCSASSAGGPHEVTVSIMRDATAPTLAPSVSPAPAVLGGSATASANADDGTGGSGVDESTVQCDAVDTSAVGTFTVSCSASDVAGNASGNVSGSYAVAGPFGSFLSPLPRSSFSKSGSVIPVKFTLRNASGPLSASASALLASHGQVRAILTQAADGSGTRLATASCGWDTVNRWFVCNLKSPKIKVPTNPYFITVQEAGAGSSSWFSAPNVGGATGASANPVQIGFK